MEPNRCVVILAGGQGSRLKPYTTVLPKPLIPVCDLPILEVLVHQLRNDGFKNIILAVNHHEGLLRSYFGDGSSLGVNITYSKEHRALGTIGPLHLVADRLPDHFLVMNGDLLTDLRFSACLDAHVASGRILTVGTFQRNIRIGDGVIETRDDGTIHTFREKPTLSVWVSMGIYAMSRDILKFVPPGQPFGMDQLILALLRANVGVNAYRHNGEWYDIGSPQDLELANLALTERRAKFLPESVPVETCGVLAETPAP